ncbi:MAG: hypothetical protein AB7G93_19375 [Bdellovibrionales bacterium]
MFQIRFGFAFGFIPGLFLLSASLQASNAPLGVAKCNPQILLPSARINHIKWNDWWPYMVQTRTSAADTNGMTEVERRVEWTTFLPGMRHTLRATYFSKIAMPEITSPPPRERHRLLGEDFVDANTAKSLRLALGQYTRRRSWPVEFIFGFLPEMAEKFEKQASYLTSSFQPYNFQHEQPSPEKLDGVIRTIREQDGKVPLDILFGINVKAPPGFIKVEVGNYAIHRGSNGLVNAEFSLLLWGQERFFRSEFGAQPFYLVFADTELSEKHYAGNIEKGGRDPGKGFRHVTVDMLEKNIFGGPPGSFIYAKKFGVEWTPLYATAEMLKQTALKNFTRAGRTYPELPGLAQDLLIKAEDVFLEPPSVFLGAGRVLQGEDRAPTGIAIYRETPQRAVIHGLMDEPHQDEVFLRRNRIAEVPVPLTEGWRVSIDEDLEQTTVLYKQGVLHLVTRGGHYLTKTELRIDSDLQVPIHMRSQIRWKDEVIHESTLEF